jgi:hypothetical protein
VSSEFRRFAIGFLSRWISLCGLAALVVASAACGDDIPAPLPESPATAGPRAIVVSGDFDATGVFSVVDVAAGTVRRNVVAAAAGADPVVRRFGAELFVVNRFGPTGSSVTILNASSLEVTHQLSTGLNSNPQDVAVIDDILYLPALNTRGVVILDRTGVHSELDLSSLDPDGRPDCVSAYAVDSKLIVVCGLLDNFSTVRDAKVAIYDPADGSLRTETLAARNPFGFLQPTPLDSVFGGDLLVATGDFEAPMTRCVARINPKTGQSACAIQNAALGGISSHLEVDLGRNALLVTATHYEGFDLRGTLRAVDLGTGTVVAPPVTTASKSLADFAICPDGTLVVADATLGASGVRIFGAGGERTTAPLGVGLPPSTQNGIVCY